MATDHAPYSEECERAVLASAMIVPRCAKQVVESLSPADFFLSPHREIFSAISLLHKRDSPIDIRTIQAELQARSKFEQIGGLPYLTGLDLDLPDTTSTTAYIEVIRDRSGKRQLIDLANSMVRSAYDGDKDINDLVATVSGSLERIRDSSGRVTHALPSLGSVVAAVREAMNRDPRVSRGVTWTFSAADALTNGMSPTELWLLAARPGVGKSALAAHIAEATACGIGDPVMLCSYEMSSLQILQRIVASKAGVSLSALTSGTLSPIFKEKAESCLRWMEQTPLIIDDTASSTPLELAVNARKMKETVGLSLIIVDYLQLMESTRKAENRQVEVSTISRSLKKLAVELKVPILALSQLNRTAAEREPVLTDLRESGSLEQDADGVVFLHQDGDPIAGGAVFPTLFIVAKYRSGPTGRFRINFDRAMMRFSQIKNEEGWG